MSRGTKQAELEAHVRTLSDEAASREAKLRASEVLVQAGKDAIPLLVARLQEPSDPVFLDDVVVDRGPMNAGPAVRTKVTVKWQVENLLYRIIWPDEEQGGPGGLSLGAPTWQIPYAFVKDWPAWWKKHERMSLDEIRASSRAELDRLRAEIEAKTTSSP